MRDLTDAGRATESWLKLARSLVGIAADALRARGDAVAEVCRLEAEVAHRTAVIREQAEALAHSRKIIDRSSAQARIGVWECELPGNRLRWTDGTYDLFDLPRRMPLTRETVLALYDPDSAAEIDRLRTKAIEEHGQFSLDVRIVTPKGATRWIRITANVETENGRPVRLFGMKQDITEEKALMDRLRELAERDPLTGLANRSALERLLRRDSCGVLLLVDLDGFKQVNDTYGHAAGDECLRKVAARLRRGCPAEALVARIGGDEFAIVIEGANDRHEVETHATCLLADVSRPFIYEGVTLELGASGGAAFFDAETPSGAAFVQADLALYAAKAGGKRTCRIFSEDLRATPAIRPPRVIEQRRSA